jgi:hypothetical protein
VTTSEYPLLYVLHFWFLCALFSAFARHSK